MFRTAQVLAELLSFDSVSEALQVAKSREINFGVNDAFSAQVKKPGISIKDAAIARAKMYGNLFTPDNRFGYGGACWLYKLDEKFCRMLDAFMNEVRTIPTVDARPDYPRYIEMLTGVIDAVELEYPNEGFMGATTTS